ncbi:hypothetical protein DPMN_179864 [Dreissena polymorpha]|uniref:Uncharacterized protein n=1 Tax=Dreissena polymorpha TaxID=45954 RepID=A0A9D4EDM0_DREPO|nr:hypothetical protein DPMN_179864 [Dreissena polymorpha]
MGLMPYEASLAPAQPVYPPGLPKSYHVLLRENTALCDCISNNIAPDRCVQARLNLAPNGIRPIFG